MTIRWRYGFPVLAGLAVLASLLAARALRPDAFERARLFTFDALQRAHPWEVAASHVEVVDIDDQSLKRIGQWPWSRSTIASLVRALQDLSAKAIAFDVVFAEPDRTSPALLSNIWRQSFGWRPPSDLAAPLPDYDEELAAAFKRGRVVTGYGLLPEDNGAAPAISASVAAIGGDPSGTVPNFLGAVPNLPALQAAAAGDGSFTITASGDQVIRSLPLLLAFKGQLAPSLALEALRVAEDEDTIRVRAERSGGPTGTLTGYTVKIGDYEAPLGVDGSLILHHVARPPVGAVSAWRLLDPGQRAGVSAMVAGRIVLIGASAVGLSDLRSTPINPLEPGVNIHAGAIDQIMAGHFLSRPAWLPGAEFVAAILISATLIGLTAFAGLWLGAAVAACGLVLPLGATWFAFTAANCLIDPSLVVLTAMCSAIATGFARYFVAERDASRMREAFTHYLSPTLVAALARDPDRLRLGGEQREMTFLFTDLEGFTALTEATDPKDIVNWLNAYLDGLCGIAMEWGGTVDKIVGDAVHIMFNAPLNQADHAERGVRCALAIDAFAQDYAKRQKEKGVNFGATRIGVNTGVAVVGNFGGRRRFDYTAHGDAINVAARLEAANKTLGTRICVARATADLAGSIAFLPVGTLMLKGKSSGVEVFAPVTERADAEPWRAAYLEAFAKMLEGDESGSAALVALHERYPDHPILRLHACRIQAGERSARMAA